MASNKAYEIDNDDPLPDGRPFTDPKKTTKFGADGKPSTDATDNIKVKFHQLYQFTNGSEKLALMVAVTLALLHGALIPYLFATFGNMTDSYVDNARYASCNFNCNNCSSGDPQLWMGNCDCFNATNCDFYAEFLPIDEAFADDFISQCLTNPIFAITNAVECATAVIDLAEKDFYDQQIQFCIKYAVAGAIAFTLATFHTGIFSWVAAKITKRIEFKFFQSLLEQEMAFYDDNLPSEFNNRLNDDIYYIKAGIGDKVTNSLQYLSQGVGGIVIGFLHSWALSLLIIGISPLLMLSMGMVFIGMSRLTKVKQDSYAAAGAIADEVISNIRTVQSFGGQAAESARYRKSGDAAVKATASSGYVLGGSVGLLYFTIFGAYAAAFAFGTFLYTTDNESVRLSAGDIMTSFFGILIGAFSLAQSSANLQFFAEATAAAERIYGIIYRVSKINPLDKHSFPARKVSPESQAVGVELRDVHFAYPTRKEVPVLTGLSLHIEAGKTVALVGASGGGKSTVIALLQRLYDTDKGTVYIDGENVQNVSVDSLRADIGIVSQEPILFALSIRENIRFGLENISQQDIEQAAKIANCHDFIMQLPDGYDTFVGSKGGQLSGGQKQRIAIARAVVRKPKLLLLDEATSALDANSEQLVQTALNRVGQTCTTVIIAHRLSTIRNADRIFALRDGRLVEEGTHAELIEMSGGLYNALVNAQLEAGWEGKQKKSHSEVSQMKIHPDGGVENIGYSGKDRLEGDVKKESEKKQELETFREVGFVEVLKLNSDEWLAISISMLAACVCGVIDPLNAVLVTEFINVYSLPPGGDNNAKIWEEVLPYVYGYIGLCVAAGLSYTIKFAGATISGSAFVQRMRQSYFDQTINQDMEYFDHPNRTPGILCSRLSGDCSKMAGMTGIRLATFMQNVFAILAALTIGFVYSWEMTLVLIVVVPLMAMAGMIETRAAVADRMNSEGEQQKTRDLEKAGENEKQRKRDAYRFIAAETLTNIRTVAMLHSEEAVLKDFKKALKNHHKPDPKLALIRGASYAFSQSMLFFAYAAAFRMGIYLVSEKGDDFTDIYKVMMAMVFGAMALGQNSSIAPDYAEAKVSANRIFSLFDRRPKIDVRKSSGRTEIGKAELELNNVDFRYPLRPEVQVLKQVSYAIEENRTVALVGQSGCGKSTMFQLFQRFYDYESGNIAIDDTKLSDNNLVALRHNYGLVQQEPVLFNRSIADNIRYGLVDTMDIKIDPERAEDYSEHQLFTDNVSMDEVISAAKMANAHTFIEQLPDQYDTVVNEKLSGGQKQRVAIARALIRKPKILLLDEATSALDTESEKLVMAALETARKDRTAVIIAHRLATVRTADVIVVIDNGQVVEQGSHHELLERKGVYYNLVQAQL